MRVAHIIPPAVLPAVHDLLGDYHLLLPSLIPTKKEYRDFYKERADVGNEWLMLDNGVAEGSMPDFSHLMNMARALNVQEIVLPDVMRDMDKTLRAAASAFYFAFEQRNRFRFMLVLQGTTVSECYQTAERAMNMFPGIISSFGIPRHILSVKDDARLRIAQRLWGAFPHKPVHLLGTHPSHPYELKDCVGAYKGIGVRGVDTSMAWNATLQGDRLSGHRSLNYNLTIERQPIAEFREASLTATTPSFLKLLRYNIGEINAWLTN